MQADASSIPGLGRYPGGGQDNPLQYAYLENPIDRGAWWATVHGAAKSRTWPKRASTHVCADNDIWRLCASHCSKHCWYINIWSPQQQEEIVTIITPVLLMRNQGMERLSKLSKISQLKTGWATLKLRSSLLSLYPQPYALCKEDIPTKEKEKLGSSWAFLSLLVVISNFLFHSQAKELLRRNLYTSLSNLALTSQLSGSQPPLPPDFLTFYCICYFNWLNHCGQGRAKLWSRLKLPSCR